MITLGRWIYGGHESVETHAAIDKTRPEPLPAVSHHRSQRACSSMVTGLICVRCTGDPSVHEHRLRLSDVILGAGAGVADRDNHFDSTVIASRSDLQSVPGWGCD